MSIYDETCEAMGGFDPTAPGPSIEFEEWDNVVPPPSLAELVEQLAGDEMSITREWRLFNAEQTLRRIAAREDTGPMPIIDIAKEEE